MAQEYKLLSFKPSDFKDNLDNTWCDAVFDGVGEPVKWVVKDPSKPVVGQMYYGRIEEKDSKAGKKYQRFYAEKQEQAPAKAEQSDEYWNERNANIQAQWAIRESLSKFPEGCYEASEADRMTLLHNIRDFAEELFDMVDEVANHRTGKSVEGLDPPEQTKYEEEQAEINIGDEPINLDDIPF